MSRSRIVNLSICSMLLTFTPFLQAQGIPTFETHLLTYQKDSPVQIAAASVATSHFFNGALLINGSDSQSIEIKIGYVLRGYKGGRQNTVESLRAATWATYNVLLPPLQSVEIGPYYQWRTGDVIAQAMDAGWTHFIVTFGIVEASFSDGTKYRCDIEAAGDFDEDPQNPLAIRAHETLPASALRHFTDKARSTAETNQVKRPKVMNSLAAQRVGLTVYRFRPASPQGGPSFCCKSTMNKVYCTNNQTSCTVGFCGKDCLGDCRQQLICCACQVCSIAPECN